jgi:ribosome-associated heat shock protein Hsp15
LELDRQRIDKWLWHARVVRTRSAAAALASAGRVRINAVRVDAARRMVRPGDVVTVALDRGVRVLKVTGYAERRGSAQVARALYEDLSPAAPVPTKDLAMGIRDEGAGRPTKFERRQIDRLRMRDDWRSE